MMNRRDKRQCIYFLFVQNPKAEKGRGSFLCTHASENIGKNINNKKHCNEGSVRDDGPFSQISCPILTRLVNKREIQSILIDFFEEDE